MKTNKGISTAMLIIVLAIIVVIGGYYMYARNGSTSSPQVGITNTPAATPTPTVNPSVSPSLKPGEVGSVKIPLLVDASFTNFQGKIRGCDKVVMTDRSISPTTAPLSAALKELFVRKEIWPYSETQPGNFLTSQKNLTFDTVTITNKVAKVYLKGTPTYAGVCDDPRLTTIIEETALQFSTVTSVEIYLNGKVYEQPNEKGE
jgi:hypothetical protein